MSIDACKEEVCPCVCVEGKWRRYDVQDSGVHRELARGEESLESRGPCS